MLRNIASKTCTVMELPICFVNCLLDTACLNFFGSKPCKHSNSSMVAYLFCIKLYIPAQFVVRHPTLFLSTGQVLCRVAEHKLIKHNPFINKTLGSFPPQNTKPTPNLRLPIQDEKKPFKPLGQKPKIKCVCRRYLVI